MGKRRGNDSQRVENEKQLSIVNIVWVEILKFPFSQQSCATLFPVSTCVSLDGQKTGRATCK